MKRTIAIALAAMMALALFAACGSEPAAEETETPSAAPELTAEERAELYANAITSARSDEDNEAYGVMKTGDEIGEMYYQVLGFTAGDAEAMAMSVSLINIRAYGIAVVMPAEGCEETVRSGLESFISSQQASFEHYLADQYEVALNAKLETLDDGTIVMVMCEGQDEVFDAIVSAIEAA